MRKLIITGLLILIIGGLIYPFVIDEVSGFSQALAVGLVIGGAFALRNQLNDK